MISDKRVVQDLLHILKHKQVQSVVISPGSRNAPLTISFNQDPHYECLSVPDERSAAFFALGMAQHQQNPVAITCTSGSAALNYYPAIAEAFYQKIPLVVITTDRPKKMIDQGDGQTIRQENVFANHIRKSVNLLEGEGEKVSFYNSRLINEALNAAVYPDPGPVHINIPFDEPLYDVTEERYPEPRIIEVSESLNKIPQADLERFVSKWNTAKKKMILVGVSHPNEKLDEQITQLAKDESVVVFTETTSNLSAPNAFPCIDRVINTITKEELMELKPDILLTFGGLIVSKMIKQFLRENKASEHWHIAKGGYHPDTFFSLTESIYADPEAFFDSFLPQAKPVDSNYHSFIKKLDDARDSRHDKYLANAPFSDFKVFEKLVEHIPNQSTIQLGNSTPVRYAQLFKYNKQLKNFSNRGTSGIDGSTSTAAGYAHSSKELTTLITGDVSFFYDSNGLWHKYLTDNLRIVLINNGGGGIFRVIKGPDTAEELEQFFETEHNLNAKGIADTFGLEYIFADQEADLDTAFKQLYRKDINKAVMLEVKTPQKDNDKVLKHYFEALKND